MQAKNTADQWAIGQVILVCGLLWIPAART
jgi:hypothetical protein